MILKLLLSIQMICSMFTKILMNAVQIKNAKIVFDDMIAEMIHNKKLSSRVTKLFIRGRKLNISIVFITQSYIKVPKDVRLNSTHFFIMKIPEKFSKLGKIIHQTSTLKISLRSTKNVLLNHIIFWLMMIRLHQIIL